MTSQEVVDAIWEKLKVKYATKEQQIGPEAMRTYERIIMLNIIDAQWKDHLLSLDHLKQGIGLVGYGQKDPLVEYKKQSFDLFQEMLDRIDTTRFDRCSTCRSFPSSRPRACSSDVCARPRHCFHWTKSGRSSGGEEDGKVKTVVAISRRSDATNPAPAAQARSIRSVTAECCRCRRTICSKFWLRSRVTTMHKSPQPQLRH
jgi:preprotein translocase subunit SecA